jgi:hypothetical protein
MSAFPTRATRLAAVALFGALSLVGCAARSRTAPASPIVAAEAAAAAFRPTVVAENAGGEWLDVYLVHERGEWYLGRVAPGAKVALSLPTNYRAQATGMVRLAVITGTARSIQASRDPRAVLTVPQPVGTVLGQRWTFAQGQLTGRLEHPR